MLCARGRHAPQRESLAFSVRLHSWGGWRRWKWERKGWNGVGLQLTRPTVLMNEIIAFGWHLFTNSCTQNLLAQRASGESVFGCPTENLLVPGNRTGGNFEPWLKPNQSLGTFACMYLTLASEFQEEHRNMATFGFPYRDNSFIATAHISRSQHHRERPAHSNAFVYSKSLPLLYICTTEMFTASSRIMSVHCQLHGIQ